MRSKACYSKADISVISEMHAFMNQLATSRLFQKCIFLESAPFLRISVLPLQCLLHTACVTGNRLVGKPANRVLSLPISCPVTLLETGRGQRTANNLHINLKLIIYIVHNRGTAAQQVSHRKVSCHTVSKLPKLSCYIHSKIEPNWSKQAQPKTADSDSERR